MAYVHSHCLQIKNIYGLWGLRLTAWAAMNPFEPALNSIKEDMKA